MDLAMEYLSKSDMVAAQIRDLIDSGELGPGAVLRQRDLADRFGVSPTPVREALRRLEAEGFVASELHRGATVVRTEEARLHENFLIRASLESLAAELAVARITDADLDEITHYHEAMNSCPPGDPRTVALNRDFHMRIYKCTHSPVLLSLLNLMWRSLRGGPQVYRRHEESVADHAAILDALRAGDAAQAADRTRHHIMSAAKLVAESAREDATLR